MREENGSVTLLVKRRTVVLNAERYKCILLTFATTRTSRFGMLKWFFQRIKYIVTLVNKMMYKVEVKSFYPTYNSQNFIQLSDICIFLVAL